MYANNQAQTELMHTSSARRSETVNATVHVLVLDFSLKYIA